MEHVIAQLRHLYKNLIEGGVKDSAAAKRIAEGLLSPAIEELERLRSGGVPGHTCFNGWFLAQPEGRQAVLRDDKWKLADAAFEAGRAQSAQALTPIEVCAVCGDGQAHLVRFCDTCGSEYAGVAETRRAQAEPKGQSLFAGVEMAVKEWPALPTPKAEPAPIPKYQTPHDFKNFHRQLCARFGYVHDEQFWWRDLVSLIEHIASKAQPAVEPVAWREQFASQVYADLAAADNQDVPLEEYPARILKVLDSIVGPRHPTIVQWRNDAIRNCASIAYKYCRDPESANFLKQDLEALLTATPAPAPNALDAETAIKNCLEAGETMRVLKRVVNLLLESRRNLGPEDHELRDRIDQLFRPDAAIAAQSAQGG